MTSRRVLWINWRDLRNPRMGGAEVHAHEVLRRLADRGWESVLVSHGAPGLLDREEEAGYEVRREGGASTFNFRVYRSLRRWIREERADLVVDDSNKIAFAAPWISSVPVVALIHHLFGKAIYREASLPGALYVRLSEALVPRIYGPIDPRLVGAAARNVTAHLHKLRNEGLVEEADGGWRACTTNG